VRNALGGITGRRRRNLPLIRKDPEKKYFFHPEAKEILERFYKFTNYEILCTTITGTTFANSEDSRNNLIM
jgi:hypothetical protein